ncbi:MAG TPA: hypothetical protein VHC94_08725 [Nitrobacter sp.]|nr:hypothetical protein [Nitrobacter sp.]
MRRSKLACGALIALMVLPNGAARAADDANTSTGTIHPGGIVTTIAQAWGLALQVAVRRARNRDALQTEVDRETVEATRRFGTIACNADSDGAHDPLALQARRRIDREIAVLKDQFAISYRSLCIDGRLAVTFDVKVIDKPH